jgi:hypothetical protein
VASSFDPFGLVALAEQTVRAGVKVANWYERQFYGFLRSRLDAVAPPAPPLSPSPANILESLDAKMHTLLDRAIEQSTASSRQELFHKILDQIVPDEARIIGALSDGSAPPRSTSTPGRAPGWWARWYWRTCR